MEQVDDYYLPAPTEWKATPIVPQGDAVHAVLKQFRNRASVDLGYTKWLEEKDRGFVRAGHPASRGTGSPGWSETGRR